MLEELSVMDDEVRDARDSWASKVLAASQAQPFVAWLQKEKAASTTGSLFMSAELSATLSAQCSAECSERPESWQGGRHPRARLRRHRQGVFTALHSSPPGFHAPLSTS